LATHVEYLPFDTPGNARRMCSLLQPRAALWVRYEFWPNHLMALHRAGVPTYLLSATFRSDQPFFRWYGGHMRRLLHGFDRIFVQDEASHNLLEDIGVERVTRSGDTRFDRVLRIVDEGRGIPLANAFHRAYDAPVLIAGSTWPEDEALLATALKGLTNAPRLLLVPHEHRRNTYTAACLECPHRWQDGRKWRNSSIGGERPRQVPTMMTRSSHAPL
jgi:3-deoxy-D-manno-octulosonic-acid transferase